MTRITNLGRKRTYLEAGFGKDEELVEKHQDTPMAATQNAADPVKKPRKRRRKAKSNTKQDGEIEKIEPAAEQTNDGQVIAETTHKEKKRNGMKDKFATSERRRQKRIAERDAQKTCLACREKGHTVKDCPNTQMILNKDDAATRGVRLAGICYRCGSTRHKLSRCKKPVDPLQQLPFASCFVCSGKGHLASTCPKNEGRGIYPNGGSCKLCGQTSHLAKDCDLQSQEQASKGNVMLGGKLDDGGADEDDFHVIKRRRDAVQLEEKLLQKAERDRQDLKRPTKVVVFR